MAALYVEVIAHYILIYRFNVMGATSYWPMGRAHMAIA